MGFIKNINNTYPPPHSSSSWYEHWTNFSDQWLICCAERSCTKLISQGAIVQKAEIEDDKWYVVPLCKKHANSNEILDIGDVKLIEVDLQRSPELTKDN